MTATADLAGNSGVYTGELEEIRRAAVEIARVANDIREVGERITETLTGSGLLGTAVRTPRTGLPAERALLRAGMNPRGLGYPLQQGVIGGSARRLSILTGHESLDALIAVTSLRLRIAAVARQHPEIVEDELVADLVAAVESDRSLEAVRALRRLVRERGLGDTLHHIAPIITEMLAVNALLDDNPWNDTAGWEIACGRPVTQIPLFGVTVDAVCRWDVGTGDAHPVALEPHEQALMSTEGSVVGFLRNLAVLENNGRVYLQEMRGSDGVVRYAVFAPGMQCGMPRNDSPQDLVGAWRNTLKNESPYTRALGKSIAAFGVPDGAEIALIGHSEGGAAVMNLAQDPAFHGRYRVTHVIAVGAPVDFKQPPENAFVATITNQHDLIPSLDGQGPGSPFHHQPHWYVVDYSDGTHQFPDCHHVLKYLDNMRDDLPEARAHLDAALLPYRGPVQRDQAYRIYDEVRAPDGFPFLTVATATVPTSSGMIELPVRCSDSAAVTAFFLADADIARKELGATGLQPALLGNHAIVMVAARHFTRTTIGAFDDLAIGIAVHDPWQQRRLRVWTDFLAKGDRRGSGIHITDVAAGAARAATLATEIWGYPAFSASVDVSLTRGRLHAAAMVDGDTALTLDGPLGPWLPGPELDLVTYSILHTRTLRALIDTRGGQRVHPAPRIRLRAGTTHPMSDRVRRLGLDGARPFLAFSNPHYQARLDAGVEVSVPVLT
ncbi:acetoacetate decarboxylase family protein [Nocardia huaxiensis]|uniref:Acetoacetate decarboxylase family protein n=1 Tax=Nocardia huaxiensis TaxID=2755382 RepID=A0A7D6V7Z4_9NOCA|nr:acetoacetate decarboxylase family protein [Nocardia huaxiensis]QLY28934.1 acetoacetate decarboxylase family protein [Nocardia huaxiensis]